MLESLEGRRGEVRVRPPLPAIKGLFGQPTIVNNVVTLASVRGSCSTAQRPYANFGMGKSRGTLPIQLAGNIRRGWTGGASVWPQPARAAVRLRRRQRDG